MTKTKLTIDESTKLERVTKKSISTLLSDDLKLFLMDIYADFSKLDDLAELDSESPLMIEISKNKTAQTIIENMFKLVESDALELYDNLAYKRLTRNENIYKENLEHTKNLQKSFNVAMVSSKH